MASAHWVGLLVGCVVVHVVDAQTLESVLVFAELGRIAYFRSDLLPNDFTPNLG